MNNQKLTVTAAAPSPAACIPDSHAVLIHTGYGHSEADVIHQSLLEANIAAEVCLTALDTLSLFTLAFKVCMTHPLLTVPGSYLINPSSIVSPANTCVCFSISGFASVRRL